MFQQQAQRILTQHEGDHDLKLISSSTNSSHTTHRFHIDILNASYLVLTSKLSLTTIRDLLSNIRDNTAVPVPELRAFDDSLAHYPFHYLLLRLPSSNAQSLSSLRSTGALTSHQDALIDHKIGTLLHSLHSLQNEWFGLPETEPDQDACYSWQDTFILLLDNVLSELQTTGELQNTFVQDVRHHLPRAIGSFLFEDAQVPTLVWLTGSTDDIYVQLNDPCQPNEEPLVHIAYVLPTFHRAVWGDPMLEAFFMPPGPTKPLEQGYLHEQDSDTLFVFPRQRTKRIWYTLYFALVVLLEAVRHKHNQESHDPTYEKVQWARDILPRCIEALEDAPCSWNDKIKC